MALHLGRTVTKHFLVVCVINVAEQTAHPHILLSAFVVRFQDGAMVNASNKPMLSYLSLCK